MDNIILTIHLILALLLISVVLMQRSDGGGFGSSGGSSNSLVSGRSAATAITKLTWLFAVAFLITSITLTIISTEKSVSDSIVIEENTSSNETGENSLSIPLPSPEALDAIGTSVAPTMPPPTEE